MISAEHCGAGAESTDAAEIALPRALYIQAPGSGRVPHRSSSWRLALQWHFIPGHCAEVRCDMVLHQAFRARCLRKTGFGEHYMKGIRGIRLEPISLSILTAWNPQRHGASHSVRLEGPSSEKNRSENQPQSARAPAWHDGDGLRSGRRGRHSLGLSLPPPPPRPPPPPPPPPPPHPSSLRAESPSQVPLRPLPCP